jgi:hypothetical protein
MVGDDGQARHGSFLGDRKCGRQSGAGSPARFRFRSLKPKALNAALNETEALSFRERLPNLRTGRGIKSMGGVAPGTAWVLTHTKYF